MAHDPQTVYLERIDTGRNMARFYALDLQIDLFGQVMAVRRWGRIGTHGRTLSISCDTQEDGRMEVDRCVRAKRSRGYRERPS